MINASAIFSGEVLLWQRGVMLGVFESSGIAVGHGVDRLTDGTAERRNTEIHAIAHQRNGATFDAIAATALLPVE